MKTPTPADLTLTPRPLTIDRHAGRQRWWHGGDPVATTFYNALSVVFPQGETFFIESVRRYRERLSPALRAQVDGFIDQEAAHTREHAAFNRLIKGSGYDTRRMEADLRERLNRARARHPIGQLAVTVALEHFTAIMARALLTEREPLAGAPADVRRLWQWHAIEEIEHKGVAFDTYLAATARLSTFRRWKIRCKVMVLMTALLWYSHLQYAADFFRQDGLNTPRTWARYAWFLFGKPGMLRRILPAYLSFYRPRFHPWQRDDRALLARAERQVL
ncbi:MAG: hypothetical protein DIU71_18235 [Proteobacteria bacterium]|nr:MAG: hypothetical protein DIU71_18235 [Pseudomonadota bacterium]